MTSPTKAKAADVAADRLETNLVYNEVPAVNRIPDRLWENGVKVPLVNGAEATEFDEPPPLEELTQHMPPAERRRWEMVAFCLRYAGGVETRSFRQAGRDLGCSGVLVFKCYRALLGQIRVLDIYDAAVAEAIGQRQRDERDAA